MPGNGRAGRSIAWAAAAGRRSRCIRSSHDLAVSRPPICADLAGLHAGLDSDSVRWSPDGARIAFTEAHYLVLADGELWLMDASSGALTNIDDDGYQGGIGPNAEAGADRAAISSP
ncbi:hypothetical protein BH23CHL8_BH23CHL8_11720 [soil metagenome]